ncbi:MAG: amidohydrolase family protein [Pseudolabrys sp.]|jgi:cytosine/adenosine deaminase-related metal-dependent hydrolase
MMKPSATILEGRLLDMPRGTAHSCCGAQLEIDGSLFANVTPKRDNDGHKLLLMPPFANAHDHVRGIRPNSIGAFDLPLELWLVYMSGLPRVDPYLIAAAALGRQALGGVGTIMIHYTRPQNPGALGQELEVVAKAATDIGVRVAIAVAMRDQNPLGYGHNERLLEGLDPRDREIVLSKLIAKPSSPEEIVRFVDDLADRIESPLVSVQYGPYGVEWCTPALLELIAKRSADNGRRVHVHLLETRTQREYLDTVYPEGPVHYLDKIGMLSPRLSAAHGVWLRPDEMELLSDRGVTISINASSNLSIRSGIAPLRQMRDFGVPFAMGLDGFSVDDDDDAFRELRLNYLLHQGLAFEEGISLSSLLHAGCYQGRFSVSGIEAGHGVSAKAPADIMALDYEAFSKDVFMGLDEAALVLRRASSRHMKRMIVNGREVARDGALAGINLTDVQEELNTQARHGLPEFISWQHVAERFRQRLRRFYGAHLHQCG